ncbi:TetR/AcrR family transcriptional regulator [Rugamonas sp.]|uniref:TetR/AcrR family transcriptional regulator n=1 Tax=Rugamonas sp. TaxID=1926287 RepID=UPI0025D37723|nr:TetR/AcrR family transcriptional regulator [Rugamonas sp.]
MSSTSTIEREQLLTHGLRIIHARGFNNTSVQDIARAAGVPDRSFSAYFASKEDFGLQILEIYYANSCATISATLRNDALPPLQRLRDYLALNRAHLDRDGMRNGCLYGNFSAEGSDHSEELRQRIIDIFRQVQQAFSDCLKAAVRCGELRTRLECDEVANFAVAALQGAILMSKAQRSMEPVRRFETMLFAMLQATP